MFTQGAKRKVVVLSSLPLWTHDKACAREVRPLRVSKHVTGMHREAPLLGCRFALHDLFLELGRSCQAVTLGLWLMLETGR
jgi:hypothetical protein